MPTAMQTLTMDDLLDMPIDGKRRWLINGELREEEKTKRDRFHSVTMARLTGELYSWWKQLKSPRGEVVCGESAVQLSPDGSTGFGVDVAYVPHDVMVRQTDEHTIILGVPALIVEILSPGTVIESLNEKVDTYLDAGVPLVWVIDPHNHSVTIYRPGEEPTFANARQELTGENVLPGFRVPVDQLFI